VLTATAYARRYAGLAKHFPRRQSGTTVKKEKTDERSAHPAPPADARERFARQFFRMVNPLARWMMSVGIPTGSRNILLTVRGRRSGTPPRARAVPALTAASRVAWAACEATRRCPPGGSGSASMRRPRNTLPRLSGIRSSNSHR
jgi:hypothetical protein